MGIVSSQCLQIRMPKKAGRIRAKTWPHWRRASRPMDAGNCLCTLRVPVRLWAWLQMNQTRSLAADETTGVATSHATTLTSSADHSRRS
jgi:hypothetical protein